MVFLVFVLAVCFTLPLFLWKKRLSTVDWALVAAFASLLSLLLSFISVWSVWTPYTTNLDFHGGEFDGYFPWSKLSYPFYLSVYHTPFARLLYDGMHISGSVSIDIYLINAKAVEVNGKFSYPPVFGKVPLSYSLNLPLFNNGETFFIFLLILFTFFNTVGAILGILVAHTFVKKKHLSQQ
jgi:hypothetical protein